ncbi:alpha/beta-hydrolase [Dichomitus squalens]|uniref:Alpha/beta-hydrolase n=2 Tax=Dichomitus squalens TaxID=114155 RepID=A0A4Q9QB15_9APHY|nr:alpha/beta-hydrolase [Dichomitus squalens LYAD-421 SS1]EJF57637.1 alpha/beta-hydrolase [Dichomitus squalens LYAD-421 SS1]TBU41665.1 alpha/beta-hydrolase [Dichomitus squalens]TBU64326.1 alpha/beta-hydrolase [Dichomitus squalens]
MRALAVGLLLAAVQLASAAPTPIPTPEPFSGMNAGTGDSTPIPVSEEDITSQLVRPALFARAVYCSSPVVETWSCGEPCDALGSNVKVLVAGGDDEKIPNFFVAYDQDKDTVVVAHQGTEPKNFLSDLNDLEIVQVGANTTLLPGAGDDVKLHDGFAATQGRTADLVLSTVQSALDSTGSKQLQVIGHSLGAAIASIDGVMLKMKLDPSIAITTTVFGLPRVGNQAWADLVDSTLGSSFTHVTNQNDPVPRVPPQFLGFQHPSNEVHISAVDPTGNNATATFCPGQENDQCADSNNILDASVTNHRGPYFANISMGNRFCPL